MWLSRWVRSLIEWFSDNVISYRYGSVIRRLSERIKSIILQLIRTNTYSHKLSNRFTIEKVTRRIAGMSSLSQFAVAILITFTHFEQSQSSNADKSPVITKYKDIFLASPGGKPQFGES